MKRMLLILIKGYLKYSNQNKQSAVSRFSEQKPIPQVQVVLRCPCFADVPDLEHTLQSQLTISFQGV